MRKIGKRHAGKLIVSLALTAQLAGGFTGGSMLMASAASFYDVSGHWAQQDIERLTGQNILSGYPNGTFRPEGVITRAEFATMLAKALNLQPVYGGGVFRDVSASNWAAPWIQAAYQAGLVSGYPGNLFMPNKSISRAEALTILANAERTPAPDAATARQVLSQFIDGAQVPSWAEQPVADAVQAGIFANRPGAENRIDSFRPATRAEVAAMVGNFMDVQGIAQTSPATPPQQQPTQAPVQQQTPLQGYLVTVPAQTTFTGTLTTGIHSEMARVGDPVYLTIDQPLIGVNGGIVVPMGSQIIGRIAAVEDAARLSRNAKVDIDFNEIVLPTGERLPIQASIATEDGILSGGTTRGRIYAALGRTAIGAGLGAALGTAMGPLSGGEVGKGAIYGTAVGAGVGALSNLVVEGKEVVVRPGDRLQIRLDQPIIVNPNP